MTDAPGASGAVWPRSLRRSPPEQARLRENGETTFGAVDRGPVRANKRETGAISRAATRHHEPPEAATQGPLVRPYSLRWPACVRGKKPEPPGAARFLHRFLAPYYSA